jgi:hypothetical protein
MARVMPSQAVQAIDRLFPHASQNIRAPLSGASASLLGVLTLLAEVPGELIVLPPAEYADLKLAQSTIEDTLAFWRARGVIETPPQVNGFDAITVIRRALAKCPDEYPPPTTTELLFIKDKALRDSIRQDIGAATRALTNDEWKSATVLAGAAIEALLHWLLQEPLPGDAAVQKAIAALVASKSMSKPDKDIDRWDLHQFIEVAAHLDLLKPDTHCGEPGQKL